MLKFCEEKSREVYTVITIYCKIVMQLESYACCNEGVESNVISRIVVTGKQSEILMFVNTRKGTQKRCYYSPILARFKK